MFYSAVSNFSRGLAKISVAVGAVLLGLTVSGAQAAVVTAYTDLGTWQGIAGGPEVLEEFGDDILEPGFAITFGSSLGGNISGGQYNDRADDSAVQNPLFEFSGLGVTAFGAEWNLGPAQPGTNLTFLITFVGGGGTTLVDAIVNPNAMQGFIGFFGIVSDMAIASIELAEGTMQGFMFETFSLDDARFVSAVPLPAALPLFLTALAALGFLGRRKKRMAAAAA